MSSGYSDGQALFAAEAAYAQSMVLSAVGDVGGLVEALEQSLEALPTYAPATLALGSVLYQLDRCEEGLGHFLSLLALPDGTADLVEIADKAGEFLIGERSYGDGLVFHRAAVARFPQVASLLSGLCCCAGHEELHDEALDAARAALSLEPDNQELVNDLGWTLFEAGRPEDAYEVLTRAVAMDPSDALAAENLRICESALDG